MKKSIILIAVLCVTGGFVVAQDMMIGNGYFINEKGAAGFMWDTEETVPVLDLISLDEGMETATLYYSLGYEMFIETVQYREPKEGYGEVGTFEFFSAKFGPIRLHFSEDAEVLADELWAILGSYQMKTNIGLLTYVCVIATEYLQQEEEAVDNFKKFVNDLKEDYEAESEGDY